MESLLRDSVQQVKNYLYSGDSADVESLSCLWMVMKSQLLLRWVGLHFWCTGIKFFTVDQELAHGKKIRYATEKFW